MEEDANMSEGPGIVTSQDVSASPTAQGNSESASMSATQQDVITPAPSDGVAAPGAPNNTSLPGADTHVTGSVVVYKAAASGCEKHLFSGDEHTGPKRRKLGPELELAKSTTAKPKRGSRRKRKSGVKMVKGSRKRAPDGTLDPFILMLPGGYGAPELPAEAKSRLELPEETNGAHMPPQPLSRSSTQLYSSEGEGSLDEDSSTVSDEGDDIDTFMTPKASEQPLPAVNAADSFGSGRADDSRDETLALGFPAVPTAEEAYNSNSGSSSGKPLLPVVHSNEDGNEGLNSTHAFRDTNMASNTRPGTSYPVFGTLDPHTELEGFTFDFRPINIATENYVPDASCVPGDPQHTTGPFTQAFAIAPPGSGQRISLDDGLFAPGLSYAPDSLPNRLTNSTDSLNLLDSAFIMTDPILQGLLGLEHPGASRDTSDCAARSEGATINPQAAASSRAIFDHPSFSADDVDSFPISGPHPGAPDLVAESVHHDRNVLPSTAGASDSANRNGVQEKDFSTQSSTMPREYSEELVNGHNAANTRSGLSLLPKEGDLGKRHETQPLLVPSAANASAQEANTVPQADDVPPTGNTSTQAVNAVGIAARAEYSRGDIHNASTSPRPTRGLPPSMYTHLLGQMDRVSGQVAEMNRSIESRMTTLEQNVHVQFNNLRSRDSASGVKRSLQEKRARKNAMQRTRRSVGSRDSARRQGPFIIPPPAASSSHRSDDGDEDLRDIAAAVHQSKVEGNNLFKKAIRNHLHRLFHNRDIHQIIADNPPLTDEQIKAFREKTADAPQTTADNFHFDFSRAFKSCPFNQTARHVFITNIQEAFRGGEYLSHGITSELQTYEALSVGFESRIRSIKRDIKQLTAPDAEAAQAIRAQKKRRASRQATTYLNRVQTIVNYPALAHHLDLYQLQRPVHMSGDESEYGEDGKIHPPSFIIIYPKWQSDEMRDFGQELDKRYRNVWGQPPFARGNPPRTRKTGARLWEVDTIAPVGLPENCYNPTWLKSLDPWVRDSLKVRWGEMWDFTIPENLGDAEELSEEYRQRLERLKSTLLTDGVASEDELDTI